MVSTYWVKGPGIQSPSSVSSSLCSLQSINQPGIFSGPNYIRLVTLDAVNLPSKFAELRESVLSRVSTVPLKSIQKLMGECVSFSLAFPGAKFYIWEIAAVGQASGGGEVTLSPLLRAEIEFWRFLDDWQEAIPWIQEGHMSMPLYQLMPQLFVGRPLFTNIQLIVLWVITGMTV